MANTKNKTILCFDSGTFFEFCLSLADHYKEVLYYCPWDYSGFPKPDKARVGSEWKNGKQLDTFDGKPFRMVSSFFDNLKEVDVIMFTDCYQGDLMEHLREIGYPVCGSGHGQILELDRWKCKQMFKSMGMDVNPMKRVVGMTALRELLMKETNKYVKVSSYRRLVESFHHDEYKMSCVVLDKMENQMGPMAESIEFIIEDPIDAIVEEGIDIYTVDGKYPTHVLAGTEVKNKAYYGEITEYNKLTPGVLKTTNAIAALMKKYNYKGFFSTEVRTTKGGDNYLIDMTCFSDDTEVLTSNGWKLFKDCTVEDTFATLNTSTKEIEYHHATGYIEYPYNGNMVHFTNSANTYDQLVTPNHTILHYNRHKNKFIKERADSLTDKGYIPRTGTWVGSNEEYYTLPEYHKEWEWNSSLHSGYKICDKVCHKPALQIKMEDWASLLAWYLSEGSIGHGHVTITQLKEPHRKTIEELLNRLPFYYKKNKNGFQIQGEQLIQELKVFGKCNKKYIPNYIKESTPIVIQAFLDAYRAGDGNTEYKHNKVVRKRYFTTSKQMADDLQECVFKTGSCANISKGKHGKGTIMKVGDKKAYIRNHDVYIISEYCTTKDYWYETGYRKDRYIKEQPYNAMVYCVNVPNETLYVRRDGKPTWSGNCRLPLPPSPLYPLMFDNLGEIVWGIANGELVDIKPKAKCGLYLSIGSENYQADYQTVYFPEKYRENIKLSNAMKVDDDYCALNLNGFPEPEVGCIAVAGNSFEECKNKAIEIAEEIKGFGIKIDINNIDKAKEEFDKMKKGK